MEDFKWFWMGRLCRNIHLILVFLKGRILVLNFSYYTPITLLMMLYVILLIYADGTAVYFKYNLAFDLFQHQVLAELEYNEWDTELGLDVVQCYDGKTEFDLFQQSNTWFRS